MRSSQFPAELKKSSAIAEKVDHSGRNDLDRTGPDPEKKGGGYSSLSRDTS